MSDEDIDDDLDEGEGEEESDGEEESGGQKFGWKKILLFACQRRSKTSPLNLCGTRCWGVVPVVHRRDPRCFV